MTTHDTRSMGLDIFERATDGLRNDRGPAALPDPRSPSEAGTGRWQRLIHVDVAAGLFGWLVTVTVASLLSGLVILLATALGRREALFGDHAAVQAHPWAAGVAAATICAVPLVAYFSGGYVAGRMCRFQGGREGVGVWAVGFVVVAAAVGLDLALTRQHDLPGGALPEHLTSAGTLGLMVGAAVLVGCLLAAFAGAEVGCRYHRRLDAKLVSNPQRSTELADAAISVVAAKGLKGLTHRAVDAAASVPPGITPIYFPTRGGLITAVNDRLEKHDADLLQTLGDGAEAVGIEQVAGQLAEVALVLVQQHADLNKVRIALSMAYPETAAETRHRRVERLAGVFESLAVPDSVRRARSVVDYLDGLVLHSLTARPDVPLDASDIYLTFNRLIPCP